MKKTDTTKVLSLRVMVFLFLIALPSSAAAYNFLYIHPTEGRPIGWEAETTIRYYLDPGKLGRLTNDQAHTLLKEAMKIWENASPYADVPHFEFAGYLPEDVDGTNYQKYVSLFSCYTDDLASCPSEAQKNLQTVIVWDEDDSILDNELCEITSCSAFAGAGMFLGSSQSPGNIAQGIAVFGTSDGSGSTKISAVVGDMVHELGHLLGLAHTTTNQAMFKTNLGEYSRYMPTMIFTTIGNQESDQTQLTLSPDDIAGISTLYPLNDFSQQTATIKGQILKSDGSPMMHVNVIARDIDDPLCEAYSFLSGRLCEHIQISKDFIPDNCQEADGDFFFSGLPPGSYTLEVEEVADKNLAFTLAPGLVDPFIYGDAEFWNEGEVVGESNTLSSGITLAAGESREGIDIVLNRSEVTDDRTKYLPLNIFTAGPGTSCPEGPTTDYAALVGIEEKSSESGNQENGDDDSNNKINTGDNTTNTTGNGTNSNATKTSTGCNLIP